MHLARSARAPWPSRARTHNALTGNEVDHNRQNVLFKDTRILCDVHAIALGAGLAEKGLCGEESKTAG